jgi:hypothetical protein
VPAYLIHGRFMGMKILRVYIDTSVIGGCFEAEFSLWSNGLMQDFRRGHFRPVLSEVVAVEIPPPRKASASNMLSFSAWEQSCWQSMMRHWT